MEITPGFSRVPLRSFMESSKGLWKLSTTEYKQCKPDGQHVDLKKDSDNKKTMNCARCLKNPKVISTTVKIQCIFVRCLMTVCVENTIVTM